MQPTTSIIITNFNYARYLGDAIDSALNQQGVDVEVIVVDDASTDDSSEIIDSYVDRLRTVVHRVNQGQAAAINSGFAIAKGQVIHFLDADDTLEPAAARIVARELELNPDASRVQFRLGYVDQGGNRTTGTTPPRQFDLPSGNLRRHTLRFPHDIRCPPMSGNAFPRWVLERIMPAPVDQYGAILADLYLLNLTSLYGEVRSLDRVLGYYRRHPDNRHHRDDLDLEALRSVIVRNRVGDRQIRLHARRLGLDPCACDGKGQRSVTDLAGRLASLRLDQPRHPIAGDCRRQLLATGLSAAMRRFDEPLWRRAVFAGWFLIAGVCPASMMERLARRALAPAG